MILRSINFPSCRKKSFYWAPLPRNSVLRSTAEVFVWWRKNRWSICCRGTTRLLTCGAWGCASTSWPGPRCLDGAPKHPRQVRWWLRGAELPTSWMTSRSNVAGVRCQTLGALVDTGWGCLVLFQLSLVVFPFRARGDSAPRCWARGRFGNGCTKLAPAMGLQSKGQRQMPRPCVRPPLCNSCKAWAVM